MFGKLSYVISFVLVLGLYCDASALVVKSGETITYDSRTRIPDGNTVVEAGGTLIFKARLDFDGGDELHVYGTVISEDTCKFPDSSGYQGVKAFIYNGGLWDAQDIENRAGGEEADGGGRGDWIKLFSGSTLIVRTRYGDGHQFYDPSFWIEDGSLLPGEDGEVISFEVLDDGAVTITNGQPRAMPLARSPDPDDGAMHLDTWINLSWKAGDFAVSHDVYLGENYDDVNNATPDSDLFRGNQTTTFYVAGFPGFAYPEGLVPGTTYYWRVDEINDADPNSPWKGDVWSFSIVPYTAYNPEPIDNAEFVGPDNVTLSWTPGFGAKLHTVYLGDDHDEVNNATGGMVQGDSTYSPGPLEREKVYYWQVDEFDAVTTHKGDVWTFTTPGAVGHPQPSNASTDVAMDAVLSWTPSDRAASHELYFGTDQDTVRYADTGSPEYKGSRALGVENYDPGLLEAETSYYWRVDEVDAQGNTIKGPIWIFTTGAFLVVDDFESYTDDDAAGEAIWQTWIDGFGVADNGAQVGYLVPPYCEQTIVHSGAQSMPLLYTNEAGVTNSEGVLPVTASPDWTTAGVGVLSLWFRGDSANAAEPLYVAVSNSAGSPAIASYDDPSAATVRSWVQWRIPLQAFADQGINLTNVDRLAIGLGSKGGTATGGTGTLFIDDIRLYRP